MKLTIAALAVLFFVTLPLPSIAQGGTQSKCDAIQQDEREIRELERQWIEATVTNDTTALERMLADDFLGIDSHGKRYTKEDAIKDAKSGPSPFESNRLNEAGIRFFGPVAVVQGSETFKRKDGKTGRFVLDGCLGETQRQVAKCCYRGCACAAVTLGEGSVHGLLRSLVVAFLAVAVPSNSGLRTAISPWWPPARGEFLHPLAPQKRPTFVPRMTPAVGEAPE